MSEEDNNTGEVKGADVPTIQNAKYLEKEVIPLSLKVTIL